MCDVNLLCQIRTFSLYDFTYSFRSLMSENTKDDSRTCRATLVHQLNAQKRANARLARSRGQLLQRVAAAKSHPSSPKITKDFDKTNESLGLLEQNRIRDEILANMTANSRVAESRRRYTTTVLGFAMLIATISLTSYKTLRNYLYLPSPSLLSRYFGNEIKEIKELTTIMRIATCYLRRER